jgi:hypothetical protein
MKSTNGHDFQLSSTRCSTCEDLLRLKARIDAALRNAQNLCRAGVKAIDPRRTAESRRNIEADFSRAEVNLLRDSRSLTDQHSQTRGDRLAA